MKKIIILSYLIGLIGFQSFTRENAAINFTEPESTNAQKALFSPVEALVPNTAHSIPIIAFNIHDTNPSTPTSGKIIHEGEIDFVTGLDGLENENRDTILRYIHFESDKDSENGVDVKFDSTRMMQ